VIAQQAIAGSPLSGPSLRWGASLAGALFLHALAALVVIAWREAPLPPPSTRSLLLIDLPPLPPAPAPALPEPVQEEQPKPLPETQPLPKPPDPMPRHPPKPLARPLVRAPSREPQPEPALREAAPAQKTPLPAPTPATPPPPPPSAPAPSAGTTSFEALLAAHLDRFKRYPVAALRRGEQGIVYLHFVIDREGRVLSFRLERGSGHRALDDEALALLQRAQPLPPIPASITQPQLELLAPIRFFLK